MVTCPHCHEQKRIREKVRDRRDQPPRWSCECKVCGAEWELDPESDYAPVHVRVREASASQT